MATPQLPGYIFGGTQDQFAQQQLEAERARSLQTAQLPVGQYGMFQASQLGNQAGRAVGGLLGIQDPLIERFKRIKMAEQMTIESGISEVDDPVNYYKTAASNLLKVGEPELASQAASKVRGLSKEIADLQKAEGEVSYTKALTETTEQSAAESRARVQREARKEVEDMKNEPIRTRELEAKAGAAEQDLEIKKFTVKNLEADRKLDNDLKVAQAESLRNKGGGADSNKIQDILGGEYRRRYAEWDAKYKAGEINFTTWQKGRDTITQNLQDVYTRPDMQAMMAYSIKGGGSGAGGLSTLGFPTMDQLATGKPVTGAGQQALDTRTHIQKDGKWIPNPNFNKPVENTPEPEVPSYEVDNEKDAELLAKAMDAAGQPYRIRIKSNKPDKPLLTPKEKESGLLGAKPPFYFDWVRKTSGRGEEGKWIIDPPSIGRGASPGLFKAHQLKGKKFNSRIEALEALKKELE